MPAARRAVRRPAPKGEVVQAFPEDEIDDDDGALLPAEHAWSGIQARIRQAEATEKLAHAGESLAHAINGAVVTLKPAADALHSLSEAQRKFCDFLVKHRLKLAASVPAVLVSVGAISPNAAHMLANFLRGLGAG